LSYPSFPFDQDQIDQSFVRDLAPNRVAGDRALVISSAPGLA